jgi:hypothetical protein
MGLSRSSAVSVAFLSPIKSTRTTFHMRFASLSSLMVAASCVLQCAFAMPIKVKMSGNEVQAKRGDSSPPSARLRQTDWREIQERQEMRKSYKRQQPSAVVHRRSIAFPGCPVVQGNFALARYPATDITTRVSVSPRTCGHRS